MQSKRGNEMLIGVSLKMYFGYRQTLDWVRRTALIATSHAAVRDGLADIFVLPSFPALEGTAALLADGRVSFGAQDLATADSGAFTGEVSGSMLSELGCRYVEVGHAERRRLFGESEAVVRAKVAAAYRSGLIPVLCVGEAEQRTPGEAADSCVRQMIQAVGSAVTERELVVAYEPQWAISAAEPAEPDYIATVCTRLRARLNELPGIRGKVIYGGSAGVGLLTQLATSVDGLFLGRLAHDPETVGQVLDEVAELGG